MGDVVPEFLNFPEGLGLVLTDGQPRTVRYTHDSNPFLSLVERVEITAGGRLACRALPAGPLRVLAWANRSLRLRRPGGPLRASLGRCARYLMGQLPATVRCVDHRRAVELAPVRQSAGDPIWLRVVHGRNASRLGASGDPCSAEGLESAFGIRLPVAPDLGGGP